jgi:ribosomal protein S26
LVLGHCSLSVPRNGIRSLGIPSSFRAIHDRGHGGLKIISTIEPAHAESLSEPEVHASWKCAYCEVEIRWMGDKEDRGLPVNWTEEHGGPACLACRRELAADSAVGASSSDLPVQERARLRTTALLDFEVTRDPDRSDAQIASAVHTSVVAVRKARQRLGAGSSSA